MKQVRYTLCIGVLMMVIAGVLLFLSIFTADVDQSMQYIGFDSCSLKNGDGTLTQMSMDAFYSLIPDESQTFLFTASVTEENFDDYILFTPTGMEIKVYLGDTQVYQSGSVLPEQIVDQITTRVPIRGMALPLTVTMECRPLGGSNTVFPPMLFTTSDMTEMLPNLAWGHRGGIPAGAFAVIFVILIALFLYSIMEGTPQFSLMALLTAAGILMVRGICTESGYLFLPDWMSAVFARNELLWLLLAAFLIYFAANLERLRLFGWFAFSSFVVFVGAYLISLAAGGYFSATVNEFALSLIQYGEYVRPMYWINIWLQTVCFAVAFITTVRSISQHIAGKQALALKAELAMENYRMIEEQTRQDAEQRHEFRNQISALKLMLEQNKTPEAMQYLSELENRSQSTVKFTGNFALNAILQKASARAEEMGFQLEAYASVEDRLNIPESDLCGLLFNLLDNAFEAVEQMESPKNRYILVRIKQRGPALGIYCANSYAIAPVFDRSGRLQSQKSGQGHGLGVSQMEQIVKKYRGKLDFSYTEALFIAQTVLFLSHDGIEN